VHHYFGGKEGLIEAAAAHLAAQHYANARERASGSPVPMPLTLSEDSQYLQTVVRLVLDGRLDVAVQEIESGQSVPVNARRALMGDYPDGEVPPELKARFAVVLATELGWAALESFIMRLADVDEKEQELVREYARTITSALVPDVPQSNNE
jgi:AcrR family transcriptional regulator